MIALNENDYEVDPTEVDPRVDTPTTADIPRKVSETETLPVKEESPKAVLTKKQNKIAKLLDELKGDKEKTKQYLSKFPKKSRKNKYKNAPCLCGSGKKFKNCCWSFVGVKKEEVN